jgi:hypothetical protein
MNIVNFCGKDINADAIEYFTFQDDGVFIIREEKTEHFFSDMSPTDGQNNLDFLCNQIPEGRRFDFDGWFFQKRHFREWSVTDFGVVTLTSENGEVVLNIPRNKVSGATNFLKENF